MLSAFLTVMAIFTFIIFNEIFYYIRNEILESINSTKLIAWSWANFYGTLEL